MGFQKYFTAFATALLAAAMMLTLGGCFYGGGDDHSDFNRGYERDGYYHHDEGMRPGATMQNPRVTLSTPTPNATSKLAMLAPHPRSE